VPIAAAAFVLSLFLPEIDLRQTVRHDSKAGANGDAEAGAEAVPTLG
jgi:hypothetical protein